MAAVAFARIDEVLALDIGDRDLDHASGRDLDE
jgi:hypothetical protein